MDAPADFIQLNFGGSPEVKVALLVGLINFGALGTAASTLNVENNKSKPKALLILIYDTPFKILVVKTKLHFLFELCQPQELNCVNLYVFQELPNKPVTIGKTSTQFS
ncbi:hypothetical protein CKO09_02805 [Chromatium weissei]|nr:hypothetical protein [Chromatium weissei]